MTVLMTHDYMSTEVKVSPGIMYHVLKNQRGRGLSTTVRFLMVSCRTRCSISENSGLFVYSPAEHDPTAVIHTTSSATWSSSTSSTLLCVPWRNLGRISSINVKVCILLSWCLLLRLLSTVMMWKERLCRRTNAVQLCKWCFSFYFCVWFVFCIE